MRRMGKAMKYTLVSVVDFSAVAVVVVIFFSVVCTLSAEEAVVEGGGGGKEGVRGDWRAVHECYICM